jgi:ribosomal protein S1/(E)-4-hydroxy-3-methyl-but-2-enyl pyrophosphate reductase
VQIQLAHNAGFCAGVKRAFELALNTANQKGAWYSLGPLVHNDSVTAFLKEKGVEAVDELDEIPAGGNTGVIIRSHGVPPEIIKEAREKGFSIIDATCPLVKRIHEIVASLRGEGYEIVIFGDANHPEVKAILGWCNYQARVIATKEEACQQQVVKKLAVVSQTTKNENDFYAIAAALIPVASEIRIFNTICAATRNRQQAAREMCETVDLMLVLGDPKSSNTATLTRECQNTGVKTLQVRDVSAIPANCFKGVSKVGITAGASTPDWIIKEVLDKMTELEEKYQQGLEQEPASNEESFAKLEAEMADFETPGRGDIIKGTVIQVQDDEVMVDVGGKSEGIIPLREMSLKDAESAKDLINVGDEIEVMVLKWDDDGTILLSKKKVDTQKVLNKLEEDYQEARIIEGKVTGMVKGGLLVDVGMIAFLPASHVEDGYVRNLEQYVGQTLRFKIIEFNRNKRRGSQIVLSRKELVAEEKAILKKEFWNSLEEGQTRLGKVKRIVDYGAFIDLGGFEGLLHVSEIEHRRIEHPSEVMSEGDEIEVYVLALDREKERVSLSRKKLLKSPWEIAQEKYHENDIVEGTVVRIAPFGAFVELDPGVDGLVHISQMANYRVEKPEDVVSVNQKINVKIISIDPEEKRIGLSIKQAQKEQEINDYKEYMDNQDEVGAQ